MSSSSGSQHWGWDFLFALIYAMFLDRWIKEALLDDAAPCEAVDEMRRSTIAVRFLTFAASLCLLAIMVAPCPYIELNAVACAAAASVFVMLLPSLAAHKPIRCTRPSCWAGRCSRTSSC